MVAPSFQKMKQLGEPYAAGGKMYVKVENPKTGTIRQVRWYTDIEYDKIYKPTEKLLEANEWNWRKALGFSQGPITIFSGDMDMDDEWASSTQARYHVIWGWYFPSEFAVPGDIPIHAGALKTLSWEQIANEHGQMLPKPEIRRIVDEIRFGNNSKSQFQGSIGERFDRILTLQTIETFASNYGRGIGYTYTFKDKDENIYVWITSAKVLENNKTYAVRGTVKEYQTKKGVHQTVLTRCIVTEPK